MKRFNVVFKKIIPVLVSIILLTTTVLFIPASALSSNGSSIVGISGRVRINGQTTYISPSSIINGTESIQFNYQISGSLSNTIDTYSRFKFDSDNNYGVLTLTYESAMGDPYNSGSAIIAWNGIYDVSTGNKLAAASVSGDTFIIRYEGEIPSQFEVRCYFTTNSNDVIQSFITSSVDFVPKYPDYPSFDSSGIDDVESAGSNFLNQYSGDVDTYMDSFSSVFNIFLPQHEESLTALKVISDKFFSHSWVYNVVCICIICGILPFLARTLIKRRR